MLDEIVRLLNQIKSVGDNIAHDLRAPLAAMRTKLERGLAGAFGKELRAAAEAALGDLDNSLATVTARLRISEIESGRRRSGFTRVDLAQVCANVFELYEPLAEAKPVAFTLDAPAPLPVPGDFELLVEAIANLADNAIKFTPGGSNEAGHSHRHSGDAGTRPERRRTRPSRQCERILCRQHLWPGQRLCEGLARGHWRPRKKSQVLAVIDAPDLDQQLAQARAEVVRVQADEQLAQVTYERWKTLAKLDSVSKQAKDEKYGDAMAKAAGVQAAQANVARLEALASFKNLTAPFDGIVTARSVDIGDLVDASGRKTSKALFVVSDVHMMRIYVDVPQAFLGEMKESLKATLQLPGMDETFLARLLTTPTRFRNNRVPRLSNCSPKIGMASFGRALSRKSIFTFHRIPMSCAFPPRP